MSRKKTRVIRIDEEVGIFIDELVEEGHIPERGISAFVTQAIFEKVQKDIELVTEKKHMLNILHQKKVIATKEDAKFLINNEIATLRKSLKMTQKKFSVYIGVGWRTVGRWERGESMPHLRVLKHIAFKCTGNIHHFDDILESQNLRARSKFEKQEKK